MKKMEALKKVMKEALGLYDIILERQLVIDSVQPWEAKNIAEKIELRAKIR